MKFFIRAIRCVWSLGLCLEACTVHASVPVTLPELEKALRFYQSIATLDVNFKQTKTLQDIKLQLHSEGHLHLDRPARVEWRITKPEPLKVVMTDQTLTIDNGQSVQSFERRAATSAKDQAHFTLILTWLNLDAKALLEHYSVEKLAPRHYAFRPKDATDSLAKKLEMTLDGQGHVRRLKLEEPSGDEMDLEFETPRTGPKKAE